jgi:hypothetical protein
MASYPRLILQFAATIGFAAMLSAASPVKAAESVVTVSEITAKTAPPVIRRHAPRARLAAPNDHAQVYPIRSYLGCSGFWCGRQFVLMVGVAY